MALILSQFISLQFSQLLNTPENLYTYKYPFSKAFEVGFSFGKLKYYNTKKIKQVSKVRLENFNKVRGKDHTALKYLPLKGILSFTLKL